MELRLRWVGTLCWSATANFPDRQFPKPVCAFGNLLVIRFQLINCCTFQMVPRRNRFGLCISAHNMGTQWCHIESAIACSLSLSVCLLVNGKQSYFAQSLRIILAGASFNFFSAFHLLAVSLLSCWLWRRFFLSSSLDFCWLSEQTSLFRGGGHEALTKTARLESDLCGHCIWLRCSGSIFKSGLQSCDCILILQVPSKGTIQYQVYIHIISSYTNHSYRQPQMLWPNPALQHNHQHLWKFHWPNNCCKASCGSIFAAAPFAWICATFSSCFPICFVASVLSAAGSLLSWANVSRTDKTKTGVVPVAWHALMNFFHASQLIKVRQC